MGLRWSQRARSPGEENEGSGRVSVGEKGGAESQGAGSDKLYGMTPDCIPAQLLISDGP
jgi:hypothetical protein